MECTVRIGDVFRTNTQENILLVDIQREHGHTSYFLYGFDTKTMYCYHNDYLISKMEFVQHLDEEEIPKYEDFKTYYVQCDNCGLIKSWIDIPNTYFNWPVTHNEMIYMCDGTFCCNECYREWQDAKEHGKINKQNKNLERMYKEQELKDKEYLHLVRQINKLKS